MKCPNCGVPLRARDKFCGSCGYRMETVERSYSASVPVGTGHRGGKYASAQPVRKSSGKRAIPLVFMLLAGLLCVICFLVLPFVVRVVSGERGDQMRYSAVTPYSDYDTAAADASNADSDSSLQVAWIKCDSPYGNSQVHFRYNGNGNIERVTDYSVDESGGLSVTSECIYTYDSQNRLVSVQPSLYPFPKAEYRYNDAGQLTGYSEGEGSLIDYVLEYDGNGQLLRKTGMDITVNVTTYLYNQFGQMIRETETVSMPDGSAPVQWTWDYRYDSQGRKQYVTFSDSAGSETSEYCYDYLPFVIIKQNDFWNIQLLDSMDGIIWSRSVESEQVITNKDGILLGFTAGGGSGVYEIGYHVEVDRTVSDNSTVSSTSEEPVSDVDAYSVVFDQYRSAIGSDFQSCGAYVSEMMETLTNWGGRFDVYYSMVDINGDGIDELLIGGDETGSEGIAVTAFDFFTLKGTEPVRILGDTSFGYRAYLSLLADGTFAVEGSGGASTSTTYLYELPQHGSKAELIEGFGTMEGVPFRCGADGIEQPITREELQNMVSVQSRQQKAIDWVKLT